MGSSWKVVFKGEGIPGHDLAVVKNTFAQICKVTPQAAEKYFQGRVMTLKKGLSSADAQKYVAMFATKGIKAYAEDDFAGLQMEEITPPEPRVQTPPQTNNTQFGAGASTYGAAANSFGASSQQTTYGNTQSASSQAGGDFNDSYYNAPTANNDYEDDDEDTIVEPPPIFAISFDGRYGRLNFANAYAVMIPVSIVVTMVLGMLGMIGMLFAIPLWIAAFIYQIRIYTLRLHDMNIPTLYAVLAVVGLNLLLLVPVVNLFAAIANLILFVCALSVPGNYFSNDHGSMSRQGSLVGLISLLVMFVLFILLMIFAFSMLASLVGSGMIGG